MVAGPTGAVIDQLDAAEGLLVVDLDPEQIEPARKAIPVLANRRM